MGRLLFAGAVGATMAPQIQVHGLQVFLEVIGGLGALGALIAGAVAIYKARSERELNSAQAMALLFEKQRETNLDLLTERDREIDHLRSEIRTHSGQQRALREQLRSCLVERQLLSNQVTGLEATIAELRDRLGPNYPH